MTIDIDEETQELIDQEVGGEEEPPQEEAQDGGGPDAEEHRLLQKLEHIDRAYSRLKEEKKETVKEFNEELTALDDNRDGILKAIDEYRLGMQALPLE